MWIILAHNPFSYAGINIVLLLIDSKNINDFNYFSDKVPQMSPNTQSLASPQVPTPQHSSTSLYCENKKCYCVGTFSLCNKLIDSSSTFICQQETSNKGHDRLPEEALKPIKAICL